MVLRRLLSLVFLLTLAGAVGCSSRATRPPPAPVILISLDGFRWDYTALHPEQTPTLRTLSAEGVSSRGLIPVFPSNTFPNHYTLVTGLYPSRSGMLNNRMYDAATGEFFHYAQSRTVTDPRWWGGEPIWVTAQKQGRTSACSFWPGSEAAIQGIQPTHWKPYNYSVPFEQRLDELVRWLKVPAAQRPAVVAFYLEETNSVGHKYGPDSPELIATLKMLDDRIAAIRARLAAEGIPVNLVVVSDHGMTSTRPERTTVLDDYIDLASVQIDFDEAVCGLRPRTGTSIEAVLNALRRAPHADVYRSEELPRHLRIDARHPRVPPIWVIPHEGGHVVTRALLEKAKDQFVKGQHGYDPQFENMRGVFIAHGPAFRRGLVVPETESVHVYNLLCAAAQLRSARNDGDDRLVKAALR